MNRKRKFYKYKIIINLFSFFFNLFPRKLNESLFIFFRYTPGSIGLGIRYCLVKNLAKKCGEDVLIFPGVFLTYLEQMVLGSNISIHEGANIGAGGGLSIGNDVMISQGTSILTQEHDYIQTEIPMRNAKLIPRSVHIGNDVWIGAHSIITAGVSVADGSVIGAGSVVTKDIPPYAVAYGVPARVAKYRKAVNNL